MPALIRIISTPPGQAPEEIRREWVGLELPFEATPQSGVQIGVRGGRPENEGGYQVKTEAAMVVLGKKSPAAAVWWLKNVPLQSFSHLVFKKECCQVV